MEAHEALVAGILGLAALFAYHRRHDPIDRLLALAALWICLTGIAGLLLAAIGTSPWTYLRLALRLTGPPLLLVVCEESIRNPEQRTSRQWSLGFALVIWLAATIATIWAGGHALFEARFDRILPIQLPIGVTSWMAILVISFPAALLTLVSAGFRRLNPGLGGLFALLLLASEAWAAIDPRWGYGALNLGFPVTYRNLFTLLLAALTLLKAFKGQSWMNSAVFANAPPPLRRKKSPGTKAGADAESEAEPETPRDRAATAKPRSSKPGGQSSGKKTKKKGR